MNNLHFLLPELSVFPRHHSDCGNTSNVVAIVSKGLHADDEIADAYARGLAKGSEDVRVEMALVLEDFKSCHGLELEARRKVWVEEEASRLAQQVLDALAEIERDIGQSLQQVMLPFLDRIIPKMAMIEFQDILKTALQDDFKEPLHISGPEDLVAELTASLAASGIDIVPDNSGGPELKVRAKSFSVTTRIKSWTDGIHGTRP
jgi:hypothetical protein